MSESVGREIAADYVAIVFRLFGIAKMHDLENDATKRALDRAGRRVGKHLDGVNTFLTVLFAGETVYVNGQPLRVERSAYDNALQAGEVLASIDCNELTMRRGVTAGHIGKLLRGIADGRKPEDLPDTIRLRYVDPAHIVGKDETELSIREQVVATYASAVVLSGRFAEGVAEEDFGILRHIKRVAQRIVTLSEAGILDWVTIVRRRIPPGDRSRVVVHGAILGALTGRALTRDLHTILRIVMACLLWDIGRPRVLGLYREDSFGAGMLLQPNERMRSRIPASTSVMLFETGGAAPLALQRAVVAYEAGHIADASLLGWPYDGMLSPSVEAVLAAAAMRFAAALAESETPDELVDELRSREVGKIEQAALELCYSLVGIRPQRTPVQFESGERGVVVSAGDTFADIEHPAVVVLLDSEGKLCTPGVVRCGGRGPQIAHTLDSPTAELTRAFDEYVQVTEGLSSSRESISVIVQPSEDDSIEAGSTVVSDLHEAETRLIDQHADPTVKRTFDNA